MNATETTLGAREIFIAALATSANVSASAVAAGVDRTTVYRWRGEDPEFAKAWKAALRVGVGGLEDAAMLRSRDGVERYVTSGGKVVMDPETGLPLKERVYSDALTMFLLKAHDPDLYKDRSAVDTTGTVNVTISSTDAEL